MTMSLQTWVVALLVVGSTGYAAWVLMPSAWRRSLAAGLLKLPFLPAPLAGRLRAASLTASGCGCDGCDRAPAKAGTRVMLAASSNVVADRSSAAAKPITFHPRIRH